MNSLVRNIIHTFSTQVGCQVIWIVLGIVTARTLGPAGKGYLNYSSTVISFVTVFCYGLSDAVLYQFAKKKLPTQAVHDVALGTMGVLLAVLLPIFLVVAMLVPSQRPLVASAAIIPFAVYMQLMTPFLLVNDKLKFMNIRSLWQAAGTTIVTVPLIYFFHLGLVAAVGAWIFFFAVAAIQSAVAMGTILRQAPPMTETPKGLLGEQVRFGLRAASVSTAGFLNLRINVFIVSFLFNSATLGLYTLAMASGEMLWQVSRAFAASALGKIGSYAFDDSAKLVARLTRNTFAIVGGLGIVAFTIGPWLIVHVYGSAFASCGTVLRWALPGLVAYASEIALTNFIVIQMVRPMTATYVQSTSAVVCAALTFTMASRFGIVAAAACTSFTYLCVTGVLITLFMRGTGIPIQHLVFLQVEDLQHYTNTFKVLVRGLKGRLRMVNSSY